jgi:hypothetical protein
METGTEKGRKQKRKLRFTDNGSQANKGEAKARSTVK